MTTTARPARAKCLTVGCQNKRPLSEDHCGKHREPARPIAEVLEEVVTAQREERALAAVAPFGTETVTLAEPSPVPTLEERLQDAADTIRATVASGRTVRVAGEAVTYVEYRRLRETGRALEYGLWTLDGVQIAYYSRTETREGGWLVQGEATDHRSLTDAVRAVVAARTAVA